MILADNHRCYATYAPSCLVFRQRTTGRRAAFTPFCRRERVVVTCQQKGFGAPAKKSSKPKKVTPQQQTAPRQQLPSDSEWEEQPYASTSDEEVPEEMSARILRRIIIFSGIPTFTGFLSLPLFYYLKVVQHLDIPTYAVYLASFCTFGVGILGISYGAISASWSAAEGSKLGIQEFKQNLPIAMERLRGR